MDPTTLFEKLDHIRWSVLWRTYGNSHATMIGLVVDWWVSMSPDTHSVLEGPPAWGKGNTGHADAMFCESGEAAGILEVEGGRHLAKIHTIGRYFEQPQFRSLQFGMLLAYRYGPTGRGAARRYPPSETPAIAEALKRLTADYAGRFAVLLAIDKTFSRYNNGIRSVSEYYSGTVSTVTGVLFAQGREQKRRVFFSSE